MQGCKKSTEMPLPAEQLRSKVANVCNFDRFRLEIGSIERRLHGTAECVE
jgi:hypothetical protein